MRLYDSCWHTEAAVPQTGLLFPSPCAQAAQRSLGKGLGAALLRLPSALLHRATREPVPVLVPQTHRDGRAPREAWGGHQCVAVGLGSLGTACHAAELKGKHFFLSPETYNLANLRFSRRK